MSGELVAAPIDHCSEVGVAVVDAREAVEVVAQHRHVHGTALDHLRGGLETVVAARGVDEHRVDARVRRRELEGRNRVVVRGVLERVVVREDGRLTAWGGGDARERPTVDDVVGDRRLAHPPGVEAVDEDPFAPWLDDRVVVDPVLSGTVERDRGARVEHEIVVEPVAAGQTRNGRVSVDHDSARDPAETQPWMSTLEQAEP